MTKRETQTFVNTLGAPGFVLDFTRATLEDFIYGLTKLELEDYTELGTSNGKHLTDFLIREPKGNTELAEALNKRKGTL